MPVVTKRLRVADGYYWVGSADPTREFVVPDPGGANGLVGVCPGVAMVVTGTQFGNVSVGVQAGESDPGLDTGPWDEVVEVSLVTGPDAQALSVTSDADESTQFLDLTPPGAGSYRVRVHARGRDAGTERDVVSGRPVEEHLIQVWPAPAASETICKTTDEFGAAHRESQSGGLETRLPHGRFVRLDVDQRVTTTDRAAVAWLRLEVHRGGCEFMIKTVVDVSGMTAREERRARRAVDGYRGAALPGTASAEPIRVFLSFADGRTAEYSDNPGDLPRSGPGVTNSGGSAYPDDSRQVREEAFWAWPLPPAEPFTLTLEWPAVGIPPASITIDGAMIAGVAATLPAD